MFQTQIYILFIFITYIIYNYIMQQKTNRRKEIEKLQTLKIVDGKYIIKNLVLGNGSFATSYVCIVEGVPEIIACKMISKKDLITKINSSKNKSLTKDYLINALKNEVNTWKKLKHKNIVSFYDFSQTASNIYFFLQYCQDGNLEDRIRRGRIKQDQAIRLFKQMADGCQYLYDRGILHRDLKPENILLHNGNIKIADFGFAKVIQDEMKDNPQIRTLVGTPIFMAPQVLSGEPYNIKCDVWSLGVLFYKTLYGFLPWENTENYKVLLEYITNGVTFSPNIKLSQEIKYILRKMLTPAQSQRISIKEVNILLNKLQNMEIQ